MKYVKKHVNYVDTFRVPHSAGTARNGRTVTASISASCCLISVINDNIQLQNIIFTKAGRLLDGVYILIKNDLGQEAGTLLRPVLEGIELLEYTRNSRRL